MTRPALAVALILAGLFGAAALAGWSLWQWRAVRRWLRLTAAARRRVRAGDRASTRALVAEHLAAAYDRQRQVGGRTSTAGERRARRYRRRTGRYRRRADRWARRADAHARAAVDLARQAAELRAPAILWPDGWGPRRGRRHG